MLSAAEKQKIVTRVQKAVLKHHVNLANVDLKAWCQEVSGRTPSLVAESDEVFEKSINDLLTKLKSSHTDFYRSNRQPIRPEHAIGATLRSVTVGGRQQWMFLDVFEDGAADCSKIRPGFLLTNMNGAATVPPEYPEFRFGEVHQMTIQAPDTTEGQNVSLSVPARKGTHSKLPFIEPKSLSYRMVTQRVGMVKVAYFSGMFGVRFSKKLDLAMSSLKEQGCDRLIIDLRSCLGGSLGFARLVSYMCPDQRSIGYDITRKRQLQGYDLDRLPRVRMPDTRAGVLVRLAQFSVRDKSLVLLTQGLGKQPFHGHIVVLINERTSSAGEMAAQFAKDSKLATLVGQTTAGLVLGATVINMGKGYSLFLPIFGWFSAGGTHNEGSGVVPDVVIDVDPVRLSRGDDDQVNKALEILAA